jgi:hypothetical protein
MLEMANERLDAARRRERFRIVGLLASRLSIGSSFGHQDLCAIHKLSAAVSANAVSRLAQAEARVSSAEARRNEVERRLADAVSRTMHLEGEVFALRRRVLDRVLSWVRS